MIILSTGTRPNTKLASESGLKIGISGGIQVNKQMVTSDPDILASGDCVESIHMVTGKPTLAPFGDIANIQARTAAAVLSGEDVVFPGVLCSSIAEIFKEKDPFGGILGSFSVGSVGLSESQAQQHGFDVETILIPSKDQVPSMPDSEMMYLKMVADRNSRKILGVQGVGLGDINRRISSAASVIFYGGTIDEMSTMDYPYAPPFSPAIDPLIMGAWTLQNKIAGLFRGIRPEDAIKKRKNKEIFELIDVREPIEFQQESIPGSRLIPLSTLSSKLEKMPREKEYILICLVGLRSYQAARVMAEMGFTNVKVVEGGISLWSDDTVKDIGTNIGPYSIRNENLSQNISERKNNNQPINMARCRNNIRVKYKLLCEITINDHVYVGNSSDISKDGIFVFLGSMVTGLNRGDIGQLKVTMPKGNTEEFACHVSHMFLDGIGLRVLGWEIFFQSLSNNMTMFITDTNIIDQDHLYLWETINEQLLWYNSHDIKSQAILQLKHRAKDHFSREKMLMKEYSYQGSSRHLEDHDIFLDQIYALEHLIVEIEGLPKAGTSGVEIINEQVKYTHEKFVKFLLSWLIHHTHSMDQSLFAYLRQKDVPLSLNNYSI